MKLNPIIFKKLALQADEAKDRGLNKLADNINIAIQDDSTQPLNTYAYVDLQEHVCQDLWKIATKLIAYYNLESVDAEKIEKIIRYASEKLMDELEINLGVDNILVGPLEPKLFGEE